VTAKPLTPEEEREWRATAEMDGPEAEPGLWTCIRRLFSTLDAARARCAEVEKRLEFWLRETDTVRHRAIRDALAPDLMGGADAWDRATANEIGIALRARLDDHFRVALQTTRDANAKVAALTAERDALREQVKTLREALEQVADNRRCACNGGPCHRCEVAYDEADNALAATEDR